MDDIKSLVEDLKAALKKVCDKHRAGAGLTDTQWTDRIKKEIGALAEPRGYDAYAVGLPDGGEFLYDLCWLQYDKGGYLLRAPLILESEWGDVDAIHDDFQKLLLGCTDLRVMIFSARTEKEMRETIEVLRTSVNTFTGNASEADYLLCCWCSETREFEYEHIHG